MRYISVALAVLALGLSAEATASKNGRCGTGGSGASCWGTKWGSCCSQNSNCGSTEAFCGRGCQRGFGDCHNGSVRDSYAHKTSSIVKVVRTSSCAPKASPTPSVSKNGRCGAGFGGVTCSGSQFGQCCSKDSVCGSTDAHCCADTCQKGYGRCNSADKKSSTRPTSKYAASTPGSYSRATPAGYVSSAPSSTRLASSSKLTPSASYTPIAASYAVAVSATCGPQAASCSRLPASSTGICSALIAKSKLRLATCDSPASTVTATFTVTASAPSTVITVTATQTEDTTTQSVSLTTATETSTLTESATVTFPSTTTSTTSVIATTTTTIHSPAVPQESLCTRLTVVKHRRGDALPTDCSCFLASTKAASTVTISTTVTATPSTIVDQSTAVTTVTTTIVEVVPQTATDTTSTTVTSTTTATTVIIEPATTTVSTSTATATVFDNPCATQRPLTGQPIIRNNGIVILRFSGDDSTDPNDTGCCEDCYNNFNCAYYARNLAQGICYGYFTDNRPATLGTPSNACKSAQCPLGVQNFDNGATTGTTTFYGGKCLAASPGGN